VAAAAFGVSGIAWFVWELWRTYDNKRKLKAALQKLEEQLAQELARDLERNVAEEPISPTPRTPELLELDRQVLDRLIGGAEGTQPANPVPPARPAQPANAVEPPRLSDSSAEKLVEHAIKLTRQP
jgi:hypothetical protein